MATSADEKPYYQQILQECNKSKEDLEEHINVLQKWVETRDFSEKPTHTTLRFLVLNNKFSLDRAKARLEAYYTLRSIIPEMTTKHPLSPEMVLQSKITYCVPLPKMTQDSKRIFFTQFNPEYGPGEFNYENYIVHFINVLELFADTEGCFGFHCIFDHKGVRFGHLFKLSPSTIKRASICAEKVYADRISSIYLVNFPSFLEKFVKVIAKPLLGPNLREMIRIDSGTDIIMQDFGKALLPKDIGGEESSLSELNELLLEKFKEQKNRFDKL